MNDLGYYCCDDFERHVTFECARHKKPIDCPDAPVVKTRKDGYAIPIRDGGNAYYPIYFCPWCGGKISDKVFDEEDLGFRIGKED